MTKYIVSTNAIPNVDDLEEIIHLGMMQKYGFLSKETMLDLMSYECYLNVGEETKKTITITPVENGEWVCLQNNTLYVGEGKNPLEALEDFNMDEIGSFYYD